ncbi:MAG: exodeoxyribonuclease VII small subunit [Calditrichae bacterium]|nr:exodeoxyribonuclease VII small subunit [Calditrichota bacterium]MCB9057177.1 exodeoxyribonuclease VII small subunit [Calditrichia bacterium]
MKKEIKFEDALNKLESIVEKLESGKVDLDESIKVFEEGNELIKLCLGKLNQAEQKIKKVSQDSTGDIKLEEFE